jgi:FMN-dependent NADH-azoreductase
MPTLLHIDASASLDTSISRNLSAEFVQVWRSRYVDGKVIRRDLAASAIPPITQDWIAAAFSPAPTRNAAQWELLSISDVLVNELKESDEIVIGTSMYNFAPPAALKLWIDQIVRLGETYAYVEGKRQGALSGKRAHVFIASGGVYEAGSPTASFDFLSPYLRAILGYIGLQDINIYCASGTQALLRPGVDRAAFLKPHLDAVRSMQ